MRNGFSFVSQDLNFADFFIFAYFLEAVYLGRSLQLLDTNTYPSALAEWAYSEILSIRDLWPVVGGWKRPNENTAFRFLRTISELAASAAADILLRRPAKVYGV
jgi:hypothetical protein